MTEDEQTEWLATKMMGWKEIPWFKPQPMAGRCWVEKKETCESAIEIKGKVWHIGGYNGWNPLSNWNEWRKVEEEIVKNETLWFEYTKELAHLTGNMDFAEDIMKADIPERALALFCVYYE